MRLKLPKSNVEWTIIDPSTDASSRYHSYGGPGDLEVRASLKVGDEVCTSSARLSGYTRSTGDVQVTDYVVERVLRDLEAAVGRKMVRG